MHRAEDKDLPVPACLSFIKRSRPGDGNWERSPVSIVLQEGVESVSLLSLANKTSRRAAAAPPASSGATIADHLRREEEEEEEGGDINHL